MKRIVRSLLFGLLCGVQVAALQAAEESGQSPADAAPAERSAFGGIIPQKVPLGQLEQRLNTGIEEVLLLSRQIEHASQVDREAIEYRRDQRSFDVLRDLSALARQLASLPEDDPQRQRLVARLQGDLAEASDIIFERLVDLDERIDQQSAKADGVSGAERLVTLAYVFALNEMRLQAFAAMLELIDSRRDLGLPVEDITRRLQGELYLYAEMLVGRIQFLNVALDELKSRFSQDPQNAEIKTVAANFSATHADSLRRLRTVSDLLGRLGVDNAAYRSVILQQGSGLSVRDFDRDVFRDLLQAEWQSLSDKLVNKAPDLLLNLAIFLLVLLVFRILSRAVRRLVMLAGERSGKQMSTLLKDVLASVSGGAVMVVGVFVALTQVGISLGPALAGLGVVGFIVGFALQDTLGNFASGAMILLYRPYDVDDFVEVAGASGLVKKMSLVSTTIATFDNQTLVVPNSRIWGDVIKNVTAQKVRRVDLEFGIGYGDDIAHAEQVLQEIVENHEAVLKKPEPTIKVHSLGESSVRIVVRPWVKTVDYWQVYWDITREVKLRFDREGISIPFPQRDVHLRGEGRV